MPQIKPTRYKATIWLRTDEALYEKNPIEVETGREPYYGDGTIKLQSPDGYWIFPLSNVLAIRMVELKGTEDVTENAIE